VQLRQQAAGLQAYQLAFTFAALQKLGAPMSAGMIDQVRWHCLCMRCPSVEAARSPSARLRHRAWLRRLPL
jgi:hypothetical protein